MLNPRALTSELLCLLTPGRCPNSIWFPTDRSSGNPTSACPHLEASRACWPLHICACLDAHRASLDLESHSGLSQVPPTDTCSHFCSPAARGWLSEFPWSHPGSKTGYFCFQISRLIWRFSHPTPYIQHGYMGTWDIGHGTWLRAPFSGSLSSLAVFATFLLFFIKPRESSFL